MSQMHSYFCLQNKQGEEGLTLDVVLPPSLPPLARRSQGFALKQDQSLAESVCRCCRGLFSREQGKDQPAYASQLTGKGIYGVRSPLHGQG